MYKRTQIISSDTLQHFSYLIPAASTGDGEGEDLGVHLKLLSLLENPAVIVAAAASGDIPTLKDYLSKHPRDVCKKNPRYAECFMMVWLTVHVGERQGSW